MQRPDYGGQGQLFASRNMVCINRNRTEGSVCLSIPSDFLMNKPAILVVQQLRQHQYLWVIVLWVEDLQHTMSVNKCYFRR